ncbi:hypothetical protein [Rhizobium laguerreae]|uniref:hypothetical protein n=1 Tax=Rhizobium laguerreae TaxID=1076926 RepID=UPI00197FCEED|nr:hypothetical protein [Rhizobium laguerreae]
MKRIGGCPACFFCPAACEVAAPIGKVRNNKTSNIRENRDFTEKEIAERTIELPQLYIVRRLAIALIASKLVFDKCCRQALSQGDSLPTSLRETHDDAHGGNQRYHNAISASRNSTKARSALNNFTQYE